MDKLDTAWAGLDAELEAWASENRTAALWWRDDDAATATGALDRLFELRTQSGIPLILAVPPATAQPSLIDAVHGQAEITPVAHGLAHTNHAPDGEKKAEFGPHRPLPHMCAELAWGLDRLRDLFGTQAHPVLVPPWNRITADLPPLLADLGYCGISTYRRVHNRTPAPGLVQTNCHLDIIDWRGARALRPAHAIVSELTAYLHLQRTATNSDGTSEPTGILTHHLAHEPDAWAFLETLFTRISAHDTATRWLTCAQAFHPNADGTDLPFADEKV